MEQLLLPKYSLSPSTTPHSFVSSPLAAIPGAPLVPSESPVRNMRRSVSSANTRDSVDFHDTPLGMLDPFSAAAKEDDYMFTSAATSPTSDMIGESTKKKKTTTTNILFSPGRPPINVRFLCRCHFSNTFCLIAPSFILR